MPPLRRNTRKLDEGPVPLTPAGLRRMEERLVRLKKSLPALAEDASQAAAQGDRSDNDAYKQSKGLLRRTHRQIWAIEDQLKRVTIIPEGRNAAGTVQLGSTVVLEIKNVRKTFEIVGPFETDPTRGRISHVSPLGKALIGHVERDVVSVATENGPREYKIIEVR